MLTTQDATGSIARTEIASALQPGSIVQRLPGGRFLCASTRAMWRPDGAERNATIFDAMGEPVLSRYVGDGIAHLQTTAKGEVWVGYFDEGIFGSAEWNRNGPGAAPLGQTGLLRLDERLEPSWEFHSPVDEEIDDCYALNVAAEKAWAYYLGSCWRIFGISDTAVTSWPTSFAGARAVITDDVHAALIGSDRIVVGRLSDQFERRPATLLVMPDGSRVPSEAQICGRGEVLHVFVDAEWFTLTLTDLL